MKTHSDAPSEEELRKRLGRRPVPPAQAQANPSEEQKLSNGLYYASCRLQLEIVRKNPEIEVAGKFEPDLQAFLSKAGGSLSGEPCREDAAKALSSLRDGALGLTDGRLVGYYGYLPPDLALMAVLASMAGFVDYGRISSFAAENKERLKDIVRFPSGGKTPDQGALRHAFEKAGADIYEKMAENIMPSINAAVNPLRDPGCGNGILSADGQESAGSGRSGCVGGCRRAMGSENLSDSSAGILIKTSEISGKSSESSALAEMLGSGEFKGCVLAVGAGAARSAAMEACAGGGMHWISAAKDNNKKAFRAIKGIFGFSGAAPLFEGGCACSAALKPAEALPDLPAFSGITAKRTLDCSHGALIARDAESLGLGKKFPGFATAGCVRTAKIPNNPYKPPEAGYRYFFSSADNLDIFACAVRKHWCVEEYRFQVDTAMKNDENRTTAGCGSFQPAEIKKVAPHFLL